MSPDIKKDETPKKTETKNFTNLMEDKWWKQYTEKRRYSDDFEKIATNSSFKPEYQKAAMQILLKPTVTGLPLAKPEVTEGYNFLGPCFQPLRWWTEKLNQDQAKVAAELIIEYIPSVENKKEKHLIETHRRYHEAIFNLIPILQNRYKTVAEELFKHFDLKDYEKDSNDIHEFFPYYTFHKLLIDNRYISPNRWQLADHSFNPYWKDKAIQKMHKLIEEEKSKKRKEATDSYVNIFSHLMVNKEESSQLCSQLNDKDFLQKELTFLIQNVHSGLFVDSFWTMEGLRLLTDNKLKYKFIKRQLPSYLKNSLSTKPFFLHDSEDFIDALNEFKNDIKKIKSLVTKFSKEFPQDTKLIGTLQKWLTKRQAALEQFQRKFDSEKKENKMWEEKRKIESEKEKKILSNMKKESETKKSEAIRKPTFFERIRQFKLAI